MKKKSHSITSAPAALQKGRQTSSRVLRALNRNGGFSILEALVASVVVLIALGAIFQVSGRCVDIVRCSRNVSKASSMLHERMQQLRITNWEALTDSDSYVNHTWIDPEDNSTERIPGLLEASSNCGLELRQLSSVETVTVSAYRPNASTLPVPTTITAVKDSTGSRVTSPASDLSDELMVRVDVRLTWNDGHRGGTRSLGVSTIVARK